MTINTVSSTTAATAGQAQQHAARHKPSVDFAKLMVNTADLKPDAGTAQQQNGPATAPLQNNGGINTTA